MFLIAWTIALTLCGWLLHHARYRCMPVWILSIWSDFSRLTSTTSSASRLQSSPVNFVLSDDLTCRAQCISPLPRVPLRSCDLQPDKQKFADGNQSGVRFDSFIASASGCSFLFARLRAQKKKKGFIRDSHLLRDCSEPLACGA